ncbi:MAG: hypothetical protein M1832_003898 [Thelocarpon impressellum]|nr:MAG: hypothetical protein M1832_003898 [Thelocarpon impressellum]
MTRPATPPILAQIRAPSSPAALLSALKALKNEIIGHDQKKEVWVNLGVLPVLVSALSPSRFEGKRRSREINGGGAVRPQGPKAPLNEEEEIRLQATNIIGSLAQAGPAFVVPLLHASAGPALLLALSPAETSPALVLATLRSLNTIADALALSPPASGVHDTTLSGLLFSDGHVHNLAQILSQSSPAPIIQKQISLAAGLIAKSCREDWHQASLANAGALDALATRLASFIVSTGFVLPGADLVARNNGTLESMPAPAPSTAELHPILEAISAIIQNSKLRAAQLLYSPAITTVFPTQPPGNLPETTSGNGWNDYGVTPRQAYVNPINQLLPQLPSPHHKASSHMTAFPPLGPNGTRAAADARHAGGRTWFSDHEIRAASRSSTAAAVEEDESPLLAWLIHVTRAEHGITRLMAASVLTVLYRAGLTSKRREMALGLLVVPLLVRMFDEDLATSDRALKAAAGPDARWMELTIEEQAPSILAMLVTDSPALQKAAVEAHAIKRLAQMLKVAYDPVAPPVQATPWTPTTGRDSAASEPPSTSRLGDAGVPASMMHKLTVRANTLKALAALAPFNDEYRKNIIDNGVTPFLIESLKSTEGSVTNGSHATDGTSKRVGNPQMVLLAACGALRALSRSVSILRTSLIDAGVVMPLFALLKHEDVAVQIAATAAVCNLVLEFSPMREAIMRAGVLRILCEQAHSKNAKLRLNALWALKNLVCSAENDIKISCLEELDQSWLIQLICDDMERAALAATGENGEPVLDSSPEESEREDGREAEEAFIAPGVDDAKMADVGASARIDGVAIPPGSSTGARIPTNVMMKVLGEEETNPAQRARRDDRAVQEQGLAFIRNLICGPACVEMIDFLLGKLGQERLFEILASKLRPRIVNPYSRSSRSRRAGQGGGGTRVIQPHGEIIVEVCFVLVHVAASQNPHHRQLLIAQTGLLKLLLPLFGHSNKNVRVALLWIIINLTCLDDQADQLACKGRALELKKLGFQGKLEALEHDVELDVRERTKTALSQIKQAMTF